MPAVSPSAHHPPPPNPTTTPNPTRNTTTHSTPNPTQPPRTQATHDPPIPTPPKPPPPPPPTPPPPPPPPPPHTTTQHPLPPPTPPPHPPTHTTHTHTPPSQSESSPTPPHPSIPHPHTTPPPLRISPPKTTPHTPPPPLPPRVNPNQPRASWSEQACDQRRWHLGVLKRCSRPLAAIVSSVVAVAVVTAAIDGSEALRAVAQPRLVVRLRRSPDRGHLGARVRRRRLGGEHARVQLVLPAADPHAHPQRIAQLVRACGLRRHGDRGE